MNERGGTSDIVLLHKLHQNTRFWRSSQESLTGENWELLPLTVELVDHIHHAISNIFSRNHAAATTWSRQPHKLPFPSLPITVLKRECVQLQDVGRSRFVRIYAELKPIQRAIEQTLEYLILRKTLVMFQPLDNL